MKLSLRRSELIYSMLLLPGLASAGINSESSLPVTTEDIINLDLVADDERGSCLGSTNFVAAFETQEGCSYDVLAEHLTTLLPADCAHNSSGSTELAILLGGDTKNETVARAALKQICRDAWAVYSDSNAYPWSDVSGYGNEWDKEYYDGYTFWNEEHQTNLDTLVEGQPANVLRQDAEHVGELFQAEAQRDPIEFPQFIDNFDSCDLRSAMCCWVSDRQANDNNGNCATPYDDNCLDADPADNTDLCAVDMERSTSSSSHVDGGLAFWDRDTEGPVHCHGFAWGNDDMEATARFKGNNLFYVSMYDHMYQRGYVRPVPGAPMCGCVEKMPIVSRSDCTQIDADEKWVFSWSAEQYTFTARLDHVDIDFNACQGAGGNNNLQRYYRRLVNEGRASEAEYETFQNTVVGDHKCPEAIKNLLTDKGYVYDPDPAMEGWTQVFGGGALVPVEHELLRDGSPYTKQGDSSLRRLQSGDSPVFYVRRWCPLCTSTHRDIVYKRLTDIPEDMDFHDLFLNHWRNYPNNTNLLDFTLHSSMEDALEDKDPWAFCNYNDNGVGFPRDCGPYGPVGSQWNSIKYHWGQTDVAFYVWNENPTITDAARPYPSSDGVFGEKEAGFCVKANGRDQNSGVYKLQDGDFDTAEKQELCLLLCAAYMDASQVDVTACETIWGQHNRGCYAHTQEVDRGNGADRHACFVRAE